MKSGTEQRGSNEGAILGRMRRTGERWPLWVHGELFMVFSPVSYICKIEALWRNNIDKTTRCDILVLVYCTAVPKLSPCCHLDP